MHEWEKSSNATQFPPSSEWTYLCEGGKHAVFRYLGNDDIFVGKLLRIDKDAFRNCSTGNHFPHSTAATTATTTIISVDNDPYRKMMHTMMLPYADLSFMIHLFNDDFINDLREDALSSHVMPSRRRKDWSVETTTKTVTVVPQCGNLTGLLLHDYRIFNTRNHDGTEKQLFSKCFCVEIKPKRGYTSISPFIVCTNKFRSSRYALQQQLYQSGTLTKDWMIMSTKVDGSMHNYATTFTASQYDPLDLFSMNETRIRTAMQNLVHCPQNNLKIWCQDKLLVGLAESSDTLSDVFFNWDLLREKMTIPMQTGGSNRDVLNVLIDMTTKVLVEETFLTRLLTWQKLDILDTDGAMKVYNRLVTLCNNSEILAETLLDSPIEWASDTSVVHDGLDAMSIPAFIKNCPIKPPRDVLNVITLCAEVETISALLKQTDNATPSFEQLNDLRHRADLAVNCLSIEESCFLLQLWLVSLTMCDVTFFINFNLFVATEATSIGDSSNCISDNVDSSSIRVVSLQSNDTPGRIQFRNIILQYQIKTIDVDRKPAKKIRSRYVKERQFDTAYII